MDPGGVLLGILGVGVPPGSSNPDPISDQKKCNFPHPFPDQTSKIHTGFQTWPLGRNYVIITSPLERKQKIIQIHFEFAVLFLAYSFGIKTINTFILSVVPSKTIPDSTPKWAKCIPVFRAKRRKNLTRWGGIYLHGLNKGVAPNPSPLPLPLGGQ